MRFGLIESRAAVVGVYLGCFFVLAWLGRKRFGAQAPLVWSFALGSILVQNQQIITGRSIVISHYHRYFVKPAAIILALILGSAWIQDRISKRWHVSSGRRIMGIVLVCVYAVAVGVLYQWRSYQSARPFWQEQQKNAGALTYLAQRLSPGDVVYAEDFIRDLVPVYTSADVYTAINAFGYLSSDIRAREAYFFDLWVAGVSWDEARRTFATTRRGELSSRVHAIYAREAFGHWTRISDAEVQQHLEAYQGFLARPDQQKITAYPLHYFVLMPTEPKTSAREFLRAASEQVYQDEYREIRRLRAT